MMQSFIAAHADAIVATVSVVLIVLSIADVVRELRSTPAGEIPTPPSMGRKLALVLYAIALTAVTGIYVYASTLASKAMGAVFGFTSLFCISMITVSRKLRMGGLQGYVYAGVCILVLLLAAALTFYTYA